MTLIISRKQGPNGLLLVVTDKEILGKTFSEEKVQLDLTKEFYIGEEISKKDLKIMLPQARDIHFTGPESVAVGVEVDLIDPKNILWVEGIPHAEVVMTN
jgi:uncharacterized protein